MNISWVISNHAVLSPLINLDQLKNIGSMWGGWQTWRVCHTDNIICHDLDRAIELIDQSFHLQCNFYVPQSIYTELVNPGPTRVYQGDFLHNINEREEVVAMHLASTSNIVLLLGFDWSKNNTDQSKSDYYGLVYEAIRSNPTVQWVLIDHPGAITPEFASLSNLTTDTLANVLKLLT